MSDLYVATCGLDYVESAATLAALVKVLTRIMEPGEDVVVWHGQRAVAVWLADGGLVQLAGETAKGGPTR
jgi:hypothetical protein